MKWRKKDLRPMKIRPQGIDFQYKKILDGVFIRMKYFPVRQ